MTAPTTLFRPFTRLVKITILGKNFEVPENNPLLRCFQYLAPEAVSYGRFCWTRIASIAVSHSIWAKVPQAVPRSPAS